jgi:channel protein (hemolysin III family)
VGKTGSIAIANAVLTGRGALFAATGLVVLIASAAAHASAAHLVAALVFAFSMVGLRELGRTDRAILGTPWARVIRFTDLLSLLLLSAATFGPLVLVRVAGTIGWDVPVLAGVLAIWWCVLDALVSDYRRVVKALIVMGLAWLPLMLLHPSMTQLAHVVGVLTAIALAYSAWSVRKALRGVPAQYRIIEVDAP